MRLNEQRRTVYGLDRLFPAPRSANSSTGPDAPLAEIVDQSRPRARNQRSTAKVTNLFRVCGSHTKQLHLPMTGITPKVLADSLWVAGSVSSFWANLRRTASGIGSPCPPVPSVWEPPGVRSGIYVKSPRVSETRAARADGPIPKDLGLCKTGRAEQWTMRTSRP